MSGKQQNRWFIRNILHNIQGDIMQKKKQSSTLFIIIAVILVILIAVIAFFSNRIAPVPEGTIGNTGGNLNNRGLFCEYDGKVYFSNAYDDGALYSMNPDETNIKKLNNSKAEYINAGGKYLVYYQKGSSTSGTGNIKFVGAMNGIYRSKLNGKNAVCLDDDPSGTLLLVDDYVYYAHYDTDTALTLRKIRLDKKKSQTLTDYWINPAACLNGIIYYNGTGDDHYLYAWDTGTDTSSTVWEGNMWNPVISGDYIYYMNVADNYRLYSYSLLDGSDRVLTEDRVDTFNVYEDIIYYQANSSTEPALKRMNTDGSGLLTVADGNYTNINITSEYVYFTGFNSEVPVYKTSTFGPVYVETFDAALNAAMENMK